MNKANRPGLSQPKQVRKKSVSRPSHRHLGPPPESTIDYPTLSSQQRKRLKKVNSNSNSYYTNPNYFQEVYDAVCEGISTEECIQLLVENLIYTDVILPDMDDYQAFKYIQSCPPDVDHPLTDYAKRVIASDPASPEALETGLYMAVYGTRDPLEKQTYYLGVLKHHPESYKALEGLASLLIDENPLVAIRLIKKANRFSPSPGYYGLGKAYELLGDYKTAYVYHQKSVRVNPRSSSRFALRAIASGKPLFDPLPRSVVDEEAVSPVGVLDVGSDAIYLDASSFDKYPFERVGAASESSDVSVSDADRATSARAAFSELQEKALDRLEKERAAWEQEMNAFLEWVGSPEVETPLRPEERFVKDFEDFLSREFERHLRLEKTRFAPDRLSRGFEYIHRYGQTEGLKRLEKKDPELAKEVVRVLTENGPPRGLEK